MKNKEISVNEIRKELFKLDRKLRKYKGKNKLVDSYLTKVRYMLFWMRCIRIDKETLRGWGMPDHGTIYGFKKKGKERLKNGRQ